MLDFPNVFKGPLQHEDHKRIELFGVRKLRDSFPL